MAVQTPVPVQQIYARVVALEAEMRELRALLLTLQPSGTVICQNPVSLSGLWAGVDIGDDLLAAARQSLFSYEHKPLEI